MDELRAVFEALCEQEWGHLRLCVSWNGELQHKNGMHFSMPMLNISTQLTELRLKLRSDHVGVNEKRGTGEEHAEQKGDHKVTER